MPQNPYAQAVDGLTRIRPVPGSALLNPEDMTQPGLAGGVAPKDPSLINYSYQDRLQSEMEDRLFNAQRTGDGPESAAIAGLMGRNAHEMATGPIGSQAPLVADTQARMHGAQLAGFDNPQEAARYGREQEKAKMNVPVEVAKTTGAGDLARQTEANKGALGVAGINAQAATDRSQAFLDLLTNGAMNGNVTHLTTPGGGAVSFEKQSSISPNLAKQLSDARAALSKSSGIFGGDTKYPFGMGGPSPEKQRVDSLISSIMQEHPASPELKGIAQKVVSDPRTKDLPFSQLSTLIKGEGGAPLGGQELGHFRDLLGVLRGRDF